MLVRSIERSGSGFGEFSFLDALFRHWPHTSIGIASGRRFLFGSMGWLAFGRRVCVQMIPKSIRAHAYDDLTADSDWKWITGSAMALFVLGGWEMGRWHGADRRRLVWSAGAVGWAQARRLCMCVRRRMNCGSEGAERWRAMGCAVSYVGAADKGPM